MLTSAVTDGKFYRLPPEKENTGYMTNWFRKIEFWPAEKLVLSQGHLVAHFHLVYSYSFITCGWGHYW